MSIEPRGARAERWLDKDAGPLVRPYTLTGGRARTTLDLLTFVLAIPNAKINRAYLQPEHRTILARTRTVTSVAELASTIDLPVGVVRVLLSDLIDMGAVEIASTPPDRTTQPDDDLLKAVIHGLRSL